MTVYASGLKWGEGPRWQNGALWVSDTQGSRLWTDAGGKWTAFETSSVSNGLWFLPDGRLVAAMMHEKRIGVWTGAQWDTYADLSSLSPGPLGDLVGDRNGNLYVDDVAYSAANGEQPRPGRLLFVGSDRANRVVADDLHFPNGLAFTEGERRLVVAETSAQRLTSFRVDVGGDLHERRHVADIAALLGPNARPDGIWAGEEGIWVATLAGHAVGLVRDGKLLTTVDTGTGFPIACCVAEGSRLFVTIAAARDQPLMAAIASKTVTTDVIVYDVRDLVRASPFASS
ncbi:MULTISPECIES: SMP-30/gluconolactonase/LRE family protein [unclassified Bradyrhizobium]|uniref:SMP-30/gluconolactonase/LRE family protein n=1 Tax=unclassified Bradyrhizobium TaxID=2631580 RepID=UPI001FFB1F0E|nr:MULTISPECIES: SMP-30/gluconolactonase/LRE family protein [unclassified Bradyrhizobium]MCK1328836.1 SMP-30/gluconolactonase/LRE family protein [Bradyrhizobium sp. CW9]MCK1697595.1 SMP-30/gluconolactonase/LRE family protein [Bradyrhizobium sp. 144]